MSASDNGVITDQLGKALRNRGLFKTSKRLSLNKYDTKADLKVFSSEGEEKVKSLSGGSYGIRVCQAATINTPSACRTITSVESEKMLNLMSATGIFLVIIEQ